MLVAKLRAVDAQTLAAQVGQVSFTARDKQITLGWIEMRRSGRIADATFFHAGLALLLLRAAAPHFLLEPSRVLIETNRKGPGP